MGSGFCCRRCGVRVLLSSVWCSGFVVVGVVVGVVLGFCCQRCGVRVVVVGVALGWLSSMWC